MCLDYEMVQKHINMQERGYIIVKLTLLFIFTALCIKECRSLILLLNVTLAIEYSIRFHSLCFIFLLKWTLPNACAQILYSRTH